MANENEEFEFRYRLEQEHATESATATESAPEKPLPKESLTQGIGNAAGRAMIGTAQSALNTEQNAANLIAKYSPIVQAVGGLTGRQITPEQWFGNAANQLEDFKNKNYPEGTVSSSFGGKVLEGLLRAPGMIAEMAVGGRMVQGAGVASKAMQGIGAFAGKGAIDAQEEGPVAMAGAGVKGAVEGAIFSVASGLKLIPRTIVGGATSGASSAMAGNTGNQLAADIATGAGFSAMSPQDPVMAKKISNTGEAIAKPFVNGANRVIDVATKTPANFKQFLDDISAGNKAKKDLTNIEAGIRADQNEIQGTRDDLARNSWALQDEKTALGESKKQHDIEQSRLKEQETAGIKDLNLSDAAKKEMIAVAKGKARTEKELAETRVRAQVEHKMAKINGIIDRHEAGRATDAISVAKDLKNGKIKTFFESISNAYDEASNHIFDFIDQGSGINAEEVHSMLQKKASELVSEGSLDSPVLKQIHAEKVRIDHQELKAGEADNPKFKNNSVTIPFRSVRQMVKRIASADAYGSWEADSVKHGFLELTNDLVRQSGGSPEATLSFEKLQGQMSDAISHKAKIARIFGIKGGSANWESAAKALGNLYDERNMSFDERVANRANKEAIAYLEKGDTLAKGIGNISSGLELRAKKLQALQEHYAKIKDSDKGQLTQVATEYNKRLAELDKQGKLDSKTLERETEGFHQQMMVKAAEISMKYDLANKALEKSVVGRQEVVRKGEEFLLEKNKEIRNQQELARVKKEAIAKRNENIAFARSVGYSLGAFGLWKFGRAMQAMAGMARHSD